jgi:catecholate siderophore receptor
VTVINSTLMQAQGATSLADALRNVPGITMGAPRAGRSATTSTSRGFTARTELYLDGMRDRGQFYRDVFSSMRSRCCRARRRCCSAAARPAA